MWALLLGNWKPIGLLALVLAVAGYVRWLQYDVTRHVRTIVEQKEVIDILKKNVAVIDGDLNRAKTAITMLDNAILQYQAFVRESNESVKRTLKRIEDRNRDFQSELDKLAEQAAAAGRIKDAPMVRFFPDNIVLIGVRDGVYHYRVLPQGIKANAKGIDNSAVLSTVPSP